jgi:hypothetical protein
MPQSLRIECPNLKSPRLLSVLCVSAVNVFKRIFTAKAQRSQSLRREN